MRAKCLVRECAYLVPEKTGLVAGFVVSRLFSGAPKGTRPHLRQRSMAVAEGVAGLAQQDQSASVDGLQPSAGDGGAPCAKRASNAFMRAPRIELV